MFTGALAASYYGQPRTTMDVDVVMKVAREDLPRLLASLAKAGLQVNEAGVYTAMKAGYNILTFKDRRSPHSLDIILSRRRLRRRPGRILGLPTYYQTAEELILSKLRMIKVTVEPERAMKDKQDVKSILNFTEVDLKEVRRSADKETTLDLLEQILK